MSRGVSQRATARVPTAPHYLPRPYNERGGEPTHSACDCITRMERELHLSALNLFFLTCIRCTCWDLMGRFFMQDMPTSLTQVLDNEF